MTSLEISQWVFNLVVTLALAYIGAKNRQVEKLQDEIKASARNEIRLQLEPLRQTVDTVTQRMADGEAMFARMSDRDHQVELKTINLLSELKDSMREHYVRRADIERLEKQMEALRRAVEERRNG